MISKQYVQLSIFPFSNNIELVVPPPKFSTLKCLTCKGIKDHLVHVIHFKMVMATVSVAKEKRKAMFYKLFFVTFQQKVHKWFIELPLKSMKKFKELVDIFITNYTCNKLARK